MLFQGKGHGDKIVLTNVADLTVSDKMRCIMQLEINEIHVYYS